MRAALSSPARQVMPLAGDAVAVGKGVLGPVRFLRRGEFTGASGMSCRKSCKNGVHVCVLPPPPRFVDAVVTDGARQRNP